MNFSILSFFFKKKYATKGGNDRTSEQQNERTAEQETKDLNLVTKERLG